MQLKCRTQRLNHGLLLVGQQRVDRQVSRVDQLLQGSRIGGTGSAGSVRSSESDTNRALADEKPGHGAA